MTEADQIRKLINLCEGKETADIRAAQKILQKLSPIYKKAVNDDNTVDESGIGATVAFVSVFLGGVEIANIGPFDHTGAQATQRMIMQDIEQSYENYHPYGYTDGSGTVYRLGDWDVNVETCHSSVCNDIIEPRMQAIRDRNSH